MNVIFPNGIRKEKNGVWGPTPEFAEFCAKAEKEQQENVTPQLKRKIFLANGSIVALAEGDDIVAWQNHDTVIFFNKEGGFTRAAVVDSKFGNSFLNTGEEVMSRGVIQHVLYPQGNMKGLPEESRCFNIISR